ncbi:hypothetical protein E2C01_011961 [Portunus trituberculatus]|uniref:Uncharacterized protein n=1 Tax=Portunus trituberculatus TaxID=210409 RepID=A0A5B7DDC3_PORTR|nr:hypothetical protein [Portunus trituberculatus]
MPPGPQGRGDTGDTGRYKTLPPFPLSFRYLPGVNGTPPRCCPVSSRALYSRRRRISSRVFMAAAVAESRLLGSSGYKRQSDSNKSLTKFG